MEGVTDLQLIEKLAWGAKLLSWKSVGRKVTALVG